MSLPYREGTWFALPLAGGGFASGVVARTPAVGHVVLCYFFGPRRRVRAALSEVETLRPSEAIGVFRVGDLGLINGEWAVLGRSSHWHREEWPIPHFVRRDPLSGRAWRVEYSDIDPNEVVREAPITEIDPGLQRDSLSGYGAAARKIDALM
jgi:hypothetical protein